MHCLESQAAQGEAVTIRDDGGLRDDQRDEVVYQPNWVLKTWSERCETAKALQQHSRAQLHERPTVCRQGWKAPTSAWAPGSLCNGLGDEEALKKCAT